MARPRLIGLVAALALVVPLAACSDSSVMHMRVGQCILLPEEETATTVETTGCTREHDAEVFYVSSAPDGDFPGADELGPGANADADAGSGVAVHADANGAGAHGGAPHISGRRGPTRLRACVHEDRAVSRWSLSWVSVTPELRSVR